MLLNTCTHCGKTGPAEPFDSENLKECPFCNRKSHLAKELDGIRIFFCQGPSMNSAGMKVACRWSYFGVAKVNGVDVVLKGEPDVRRRSPEECLPFLKGAMEKWEMDARNEERLTTRVCFNVRCNKYLKARNGLKTCPMCSEALIKTDTVLRCWTPDCDERDVISADEICKLCGKKRIQMPLLSTELKKSWRINTEGKVERVALETKSEAKADAAPATTAAEDGDDE